MPYCNECGSKIEAGVRCPACENNPCGQGAAESADACACDTDAHKRAGDCESGGGCDCQSRAQCRETKKHKSFCDTKDSTETFTEEARGCHPLSGVICYLGPLCLLPVLFGEKNPYLRYHANQGLVLFLLELLTCLVVGVACAVDPLLPSVTPLLAAGSELMALFSLYLAGIGVSNAMAGKAKELPVIGSCVVIR